jgi:hypothetical protein
MSPGQNTAAIAYGDTPIRASLLLDSSSWLLN